MRAPKGPRPYYLLLARASATAPWCLEFGDYSRKVVEQERRDYRDSTRARLSDTKLLSLPTDTQAAIDAALAEENARAVL